MKNILKPVIEILWGMPLFVLYTFFIFSVSSLIFFMTQKNMMNNVAALLTVPSLIAIIYLTPKVKDEVVKYRHKKRLN